MLASTSKNSVKVHKNSWFANGKLLLTGEFLVLDGAKALAVPLKFGQHFTVNNTQAKTLEWEAKSPEGTWVKAILRWPELEVLETTGKVHADRLVLLLQKVIELSPVFIEKFQGARVETLLDFNPAFGFGSSSTLIYCLATWAGIDPYKLQQQSFGGSGFDIACADAKGPITYQRFGEQVEIKNVDISSAIKNHLYFVYLGNKQQTFGSIQKFRENAAYSSSDIQTITSITNELVKTDSIGEFERLLAEHEKLMSRILKTPTVKSSCFSRYDGCVKSLGAWGGDFVLVTSHLPKQVFADQMKELGFPVSFSYHDLVLA